ncbi:MAG TPA: CAP domain-containing protein [Pyrinomonadaceae bacterium]|jgi:uncharacterized protein YkwD
MKIFNLFPSIAGNRLPRLLLLSAFSFFLIVGNAINGHAQSQSARQEVARLITSSGNVSTLSTRPRLINASHDGGAIVSSAAVSATSDERRAFDLVNAERRARGESALVWDAELTRMARLHSEKMARQKFFSHTGPDGQGLRERSRANGITGFKSLAENLAYNRGFSDAATSAVVGWMRSAGHRDNILNEEFTRTGIGVARSEDGRVYFTQVFVAR